MFVGSTHILRVCRFILSDVVSLLNFSYELPTVSARERFKVHFFCSRHNLIYSLSVYFVTNLIYFQPLMFGIIFILVFNTSKVSFQSLIFEIVLIFVFNISKVSFWSLIFSLTNRRQILTGHLVNVSCSPDIMTHFCVDVPHQHEKIKMNSNLHRLILIQLYLYIFLSQLSQQIIMDCLLFLHISIIGFFYHLQFAVWQQFLFFMCTKNFFYLHFLVFSSIFSMAKDQIINSHVRKGKQIIVQN